MPIDPVSQGAAQPTAAKSKLNADFDMFLGLLTAQMKFQDPLDPVDTAQYSQQLVQYSAVEQAVAQTDLLKSILSRLEQLEAAPAPIAALTNILPATPDETPPVLN